MVSRYERDGLTIYQCYVVIETPSGVIASEALKEIKKEDKMYLRYKESELMKKLEAQVREYEAGRMSQELLEKNK